jgi:hypothetical protein
VGELPQASTGEEACPRFHINNDVGKLSRLMVATRKYKETMTCKLAEVSPDSVLYAEGSG